MDAAAADARSWGCCGGEDGRLLVVLGVGGTDSLAQCLELELCPDLPTTQVGELTESLTQKKRERQKRDENKKKKISMAKKQVAVVICMYYCNTVLATKPGQSHTLHETHSSLKVNKI